MADMFLVEFKGHRREYFVNSFHHVLKRREPVITDAAPGEDYGWILHRSDHSELARQKTPHRSILRTATSDETDVFTRIRPRELAAKAQGRAVARRLGLDLKLSDVEQQFDGSKMTFYYTSEGRVDFRQLVRELAVTFRTWIEMRQISPREETRRVGDCGLCGGEVCCRKANLGAIQVSTQDARDQDLQINLSKLTGLCGKLRCCLTFERDQYIDSKKLFPGRGSLVETPTGVGVIEKIDTFREEAVVRMEDGAVFRCGPDQVRRISRRDAAALSERSVTVANAAPAENGAGAVNGDAEQTVENQ